MQNPNQYEPSPLKLYSALQRQLVASGQTKGTPQQWVGTILNLQKKGASTVEIEWSTIIPVLEEHPEPLLHIDELLAFLADKPPCELVLQRCITHEYAPRVRYEKQQRPAKLPPITVCRGRREIRLLHFVDRTFGLSVWLHGVEVDTALFGRLRYKYWSLSVPRGSKKLAPHSVGGKFKSLQEALAYGRTLVERMAKRLESEGFFNQTRSVNQFTRYVLPGGEHYTEWLITAPNLLDEYWGPHFDIPNIVAHVRTTERITPQGARLLVLEEIQSDWNQILREAIKEARSRNPADEADRDMIEWDDDLDPPPFNPYLNHWLEAALRMMLLLAANQGFAGIAWLPGKLHAERFYWANAGDGLKTFYDRIVPAAVEKLGRSWGAQLDEAQLKTMSRRFGVRQVAGKKWRVLNLDSGLAVGEDFTDQDKADAFCRSQEVSVWECVTALYVTDEMRADILKDGLPYIGAVGKRLATAHPLCANGRESMKNATLSLRESHDTFCTPLRS